MSLIEKIWEELDVEMVGLMIDPDDERSKGMALGLATALAILTNGYDPDIDAIRAQAYERWEARNRSQE